MIKINTNWTGPLANGKYKDILIQEFDRTMQRAVTATEEAAILEAKGKGLRGVTGHLLAGIKGKKISFIYGRVGIEGPASVYGEVMEKGRKAGSKMPPVDALLRWVQMKFMPSKGITIESPRQIKSYAFRIAKSIKAKSITGRHFFRAAERKMKPKIIRMYDTMRIRLESRLSDK